MANNQNFHHSTIHDINRWVRSFDFSTEEDKIWLDGPDGSGSVGQQGTGPTLAKAYR